MASKLHLHLQPFSSVSNLHFHVLQCLLEQSLVPSHGAAFAIMVWVPARIWSSTRPLFCNSAIGTIFWSLSTLAPASAFTNMRLLSSSVAVATTCTIFPLHRLATRFLEARMDQHCYSILLGMPWSKQQAKREIITPPFPRLKRRDWRQWVTHNFPQSSADKRLSATALTEKQTQPNSRVPFAITIRQRPAEQGVCRLWLRRCRSPRFRGRSFDPDFDRRCAGWSEKPLAREPSDRTLGRRG